MDTLPLDVTSSESITAAVGSVKTLTGSDRLDFLVNNSGMGYHIPLIDTNMDEARRMFDVNFWSVLEMIKAFAPLLIAAKGTIVNNASCAAVTPVPYQGIYNASKSAVTMLGDTLASELKPFGVKTLTLITGTVKTNFYHTMHRESDLALPEGSLYAPVKEHVKAVADGTFLTGWIPGDQYAKNVVSDVLKSKDSELIWRGGSSTKIWLMTFLPRWVMIWFCGSLGKVDVLTRIWKRTGGSGKTK